MRHDFSNDYSEGAHEAILSALERTNREQGGTYGLDRYSEEARERIRSLLERPESAVHFLTGGTQVNATLLTAALRPHQGVLCARTGHINVHEAGAVEAGGHKVLPLPHTEGKVDAATVERAFIAHYTDATAEHMVQPGALYISHPTELGAVYSKGELRALRQVCGQYNAKLYLDGARLGCALTAEGCDVTLRDLAELTHAFTIGGTKMGALFGEALVINDPALDQDFRYILKQRGALLAKGRLLGLQFLTLFTDGLYFDLARHANAQAARIREGLKEKGAPLLSQAPTNQVFAILERDSLKSLEGEFGFAFWQKMDDRRDAVRFCTSWATPPAAVDALLDAIPKQGEN